MPLRLRPAHPLAESVQRVDSFQHTRAIRVASVLFLATLTAAAAQISIPLPFTAVPFTFGPIAALIAGLALGPRLGAASQAVYLAAGIAGLPVFAASMALAPGVGRLLGPTGGYLMAYPLAACVTGYLGARGFDRAWSTSALAMLAGIAVVYAGGVSWLTIFVGLQPALTAGFYPFAIADVLKIVGVAGVVPSMRRLLSGA